MPLLMLVGLAITIAVWTQVSWVWGLITGFFLVGGLGWKLLASAGGFIAGRRHPETKDFIAAWESRVGEMRFGQPGTHPPPDVYQAWRQAHEREGISAGDWLDRLESRMKAPKAKAVISGLFETVGRWEGTADAHPEGVFVIGERIWWESDTGRPEDARERREPSERVVPWDQVESAIVTETSIELKPIIPSGLFSVTLTDFDHAGQDPWLQLIQQNGISLEREGTRDPHRGDG